MAKGKRLKQAYSVINRDAFYPIDKAVDLIKSGAKAKFDETIEIAMNLGIDQIGRASCRERVYVLV